jgi:hypothetical protein
MTFRLFIIRLPDTGMSGLRIEKNGVADGIRTRNIQNHNLGLYH